MRLGAPVFEFASAEEWALRHVQKGYGAAYWPLPEGAADREIDEYVEAAARHDLVIAEVGVWNNVLHRDPEAREANIRYAISRLRTADRVGARCCVNISGSFSDQWDGPHPDNLTERAFDAVVTTTRRILDSANPVRAEYSLEPMGWMVPYDVITMRRLIDAIDRPAFGVHVDMCNMAASPILAYRTGASTRAFFGAFGPLIRSVHAKDIALRPTLTAHVDEVVPGEGLFDYETLLTEAAKIDDLPVMCEHLRTAGGVRPRDGAHRARGRPVGAGL